MLIKRFFGGRVYRNSEDGGEGGGGGGSAPFSDAQLEALDKKINGALSGHGNRIRDALGKQMSEMGDGLKNQVAGMFDEFRGSLGPAAGSKEGGQDDKGSGDDKVDARIAAAEARMAAAEKKFEAERQAREQEAVKGRLNNERSRLAAALSAAGVDGSRSKAAVALLHTEEKRIATDEHGNVVVKFQRDGYEESVPLETGVAEWLQTPDGKHFAPARPASGSGASGGSRPGGGGQGKASPEELRRKLAEQFFNLG